MDDIMESLVPGTVRDFGAAQVPWKKKLSLQVGEYRRGGARGGVVRMPARDKDKITTPVRHLLDYGKVELTGEQHGPYWYGDADAGQHKGADDGASSSTRDTYHARSRAKSLFTANKETMMGHSNDDSSSSPEQPSSCVDSVTSKQAERCTGTGAKQSQLHHRVLMTNFSTSSPPTTAAQSGSTVPGRPASQTAHQQPNKRHRAPADSSDEEGNTGPSQKSSVRAPAASAPKQKQHKSSVERGARVYIPCGVFPQHAAPRVGYWEGLVVTNRPTGRPGQVKIKCVGEAPFYWDEKEVVSWLVKPAHQAGNEPRVERDEPRDLRTEPSPRDKPRSKRGKPRSKRDEPRSKRDEPRRQSKRKAQARQHDSSEEDNSFSVDDDSDEENSPTEADSVCSENM
mmetsp:Transcript_4593/g.7014  ORF Transcript_4593/g.7014 Transcript_4593/m.7014 type:complete len:398 (-) Transcript_4593:952-2145(-)